MVGNAKPSELVSYMCRAINSGSRLLIGIEKKEDKWHEKVQLGGSKVCRVVDRLFFDRKGCLALVTNFCIYLALLINNLSVPFICSFITKIMDKLILIELDIY